jgi:hypothetical protein
MKKLSIVITEIFLVKVGWDKTFVGELVREVEDGDNNSLKVIFHGSVVINEGKIYSTGKTIDELGSNLDAIATMKLDGNLHGDEGKFYNVIPDLIDTPAIDCDEFIKLQFFGLN